MGTGIFTLMNFTIATGLAEMLQISLKSKDSKVMQCSLMDTSTQTTSIRIVMQEAVTKLLWFNLNLVESELEILLLKSTSCEIKYI